MEKHSVEYLSNLLRLWRTSKENPWRASLEDPQTGERRGFADLEALWAYLQQGTESMTDEGISDTCLEHELQLP